MDKNGNYLTKMITTAMSKGRILKYDELLYEVTNINKYFKYPLKRAVMDAFKEGILQPVVLPPGINEKVPTSVPFILVPVKGNIGAMVFIDNYKSYSEKDDVYNIDPKKLYCLLESAFMGIIIQKNYKVLFNNNIINTEAASIYAHTFIRVLNRKYALNVDKRAYAKMLYLAAKFFMVCELGLDPLSESVSNYAFKVSEAESPFLVREVDAKFKPEDYKDLGAFINAIKTNAYLITHSLSELTVRDYITDYVGMYHSSAIFALEHFAYFTFMVDSVILGAYLNNQAILEDIVGKSGAKVYSLLTTYQNI